MSNHHEFLVTFLPSEMRRLTRTGIQIHSLQYWSDVLAQWVGQGLDVRVHYDPRDISVVHVRTPAGILTKAKMTTPGVPAISLAEWESIRTGERVTCKDPALITTADESLKRGDQLVAHAKKSRALRRRQSTEAAGDKWRTEPAPTTSAPMAPMESSELPMTLPALADSPTYYEIEEYDHVA